MPDSFSKHAPNIGRPFMVETRPFDPAEYLGDTEAIKAYLADALEDGTDEFLEALSVVARAWGMTALAEKAGVARPAPYRSQRANGHPDTNTVVRVIASFWAYRCGWQWPARPHLLPLLSAQNQNAPSRGGRLRRPEPGGS